MLKGCCKESFAFYLYFHSSHAYTLAQVRTDAHRQKRKLEIPTVKVYTGNVFLLSRAKRGRRQGDIYHHITVWCSTSVFLLWATLASLATINKPFLESSFYPAQRTKFHVWVGPRAGSSTLFNLDRIFFNSPILERSVLSSSIRRLAEMASVDVIGQKVGKVLGKLEKVGWDETSRPAVLWNASGYYRTWEEGEDLLLEKDLFKK